MGLSPLISISNVARSSSIQFIKLYLMVTLKPGLHLVVRMASALFASMFEKLSTYILAFVYSKSLQIRNSVFVIRLTKFFIDPFTKRHELVHNGRFPKSEVLYCSQNTVKSIKIQ